MCKHPCGRIVQILLLDNFSTVHKTWLVVDMIQALGVQVELIPPSFTAMVQLVDMGCNKPLKSRFCSKYHEWMMEQDPNQLISCPACCLVAMWIIVAEWAITVEMVHNAWKYPFFDVNHDTYDKLLLTISKSLLYE